ncbi:MAG: DegT/DnrJ/EryC1/StrS family aminotransferase [Hyphomicrobiaceae bacterium]|nr:MAG: DegT/DnrJ/EryC1/StrS family aminotransferase [Hyphomicrobiaceae bacterium]
MRSGEVNQWTGKGKKEHVFNFERELARLAGVPHAIALANGSVALDLALKVLGIGPGDEVIVTPRSFIASASCVSLTGATPIFAEVDEESGDISPATIAPLIGPRTKGIIPVHLAGWPCDMPAIMALAEKHKLWVVEDCAQAIGASVNGRAVGSFGQLAIYSFCQDKIITTAGEGGALLLRDEEQFKRAWSYKDHGKSFEATMGAAVGGDKFRWVHQSFGTNWRMLELQAAVGRIQLGKLEGWLDARARNAGIWIDALSPLAAVRVPLPSPGMRHAFYKVYAYVRPERLKPGVDRDRLLSALTEGGIKAFHGSCGEIYREGAYRRLHMQRLAIARRLHETSLMFEVHPTLDSERLQTRARRAAEIIRTLSLD